jgi:hypothetical protein
MHVIAAKAVALGEALQRDFKVYQERVLENARVLARVLTDRGVRIVSGGTDCHMFLVDLRAKGITGKDAEAALGRAHITVNKNAIPNDPEKPFVTSGIRLGSPAITTRGFTEIESEELAHLIADVLSAPEDGATLEKVRSSVSALARMFRSTGRSFAGFVESPHEMSFLRQPRDAGHRLARVGSGRLDPPPPPVHGCQKRFTTYETVELRLPQVVKTNGNRADFSADKIRVGSRAPAQAARADGICRRRHRPHRCQSAGQGRARDRGARDRRDGHGRALQARQGRLHPLRVRLSLVPGRLGLSRRLARGRDAAGAGKRPKRGNQGRTLYCHETFKRVPTLLTTETDRSHMARALALAERGLFTTTPNPRVGCVIARGEAVIGEGFHSKAGEAHAGGCGACRCRKPRRRRERRHPLT